MRRDRSSISASGLNLCPLRDELLNETLFTSLAQARVAIALWRADYNTARPHSQIAWHRPSSPPPSIRDGRSRCAMPKAPRQRPSLHPPSRAQPTPETNSKLDRNWGNVTGTAGAALEASKKECAQREEDEMSVSRDKFISVPEQVHDLKTG